MTCGRGLKTRTQTCPSDYPLPSASPSLSRLVSRLMSYLPFGTDPASGTPKTRTDRALCYGPRCPAQCTPWSAYDRCNVTCGSGWQTSKRLCCDGESGGLHDVSRVRTCHTGVACPTVGCKSRKRDVFFLIDATESNNYLDIYKKFVVDFYEEIDVGDDAGLVALAIFFKHTCLYCSFTKSKSRDIFKKCVYAPKLQTRSYSNLYYAVFTALNTFTDGLYGERESADNVVIFMTTGNHNYINTYRAYGSYSSYRAQYYDSYYNKLYTKKTTELKTWATVHVVSVGRSCKLDYFERLATDENHRHRPDKGERDYRKFTEIKTLAVQLAKEEVCL